MDFVSRYGLLGFMTALPTTPNFMDYEAVYLPKNNFIKEESLKTDDFISHFYPFGKPDFKKKRIEYMWNITGDRTMLALAMTFSDKPMAMNMSFQREYAEPYDWLPKQFKDWAFMFWTAKFYYEDADTLDEEARGLMRPTIVWDFHSLLLGVQMMLSFALTDEQKSLCVCRQCQKAFVASRFSAAFCSPQCNNRYNVYKSRAKGSNL